MNSYEKESLIINIYSGKLCTFLLLVFILNAIVTIQSVLLMATSNDVIFDRQKSSNISNEICSNGWMGYLLSLYYYTI